MANESAFARARKAARQRWREYQRQASEQSAPTKPERSAASILERVAGGEDEDGDECGGTGL